MMSLIAQVATNTDPFGGWGSLVLQGGAFGLLVYVVTVMYPRAAKDQREEREKQDEVFRKTLSDLQMRFEARNDKITVAVNAQTDKLATALTQNADRIEQAVASVCRHTPPK